MIYKLDSDEILGAKDGDSGLAELQIPADEVREWTVEADFVNTINGRPQGDTSFEAGVNYMEFTEAVFRSVERNATVNLPLVD